MPIQNSDFSLYLTIQWEKGVGERGGSKTRNKMLFQQQCHHCEKQVLKLGWLKAIVCLHDQKCDSMWQEKRNEYLKRVEEVGIVPLVWNGSSKPSGPKVRSDSSPQKRKLIQLIHKCMFPMRAYTHPHRVLHHYTERHKDNGPHYDDLNRHRTYYA